MKRYGFLLLPGFSLLDLAFSTEVLRLANTYLGGRAHEVVLLSVDGQPVPAAGSELLAVTRDLNSFSSLSGLFIVADTMPNEGDLRISAIKSACAAIERMNGPDACVFGGIGAGSAWLAYAGYLRGVRCTINSEYAEQLSAACPDTIVSSFLYEIDRNRLSCAGGSTGMELMICWLAQQHGERLLQRLLNHFGLERLRDSRARQTTPSALRAGNSAKLAEAIALMESNLSEPLSTEEIAGLVGVSRRQLERLFKQHLDTLPSRWYLEQRLERAQRLLQQSSQSILQIGLSCGFTSGAHFSNACRQFFERTPRDERSARAAAWRAAPATDSRPMRVSDRINPNPSEDKI